MTRAIREILVMKTGTGIGMLVAAIIAMRLAGKLLLLFLLRAEVGVNL